MENRVKSEILEQYQQRQNYLLAAKILIAIALYLITTATLLEYLSVTATLKTIGFMLCAHAFYFLFRFRQLLS